MLVVLKRLSSGMAENETNTDGELHQHHQPDSLLNAGNSGAGQVGVPQPQEHVAGYINMIKNFSGTEPFYRAEQFFQEVQNIAVIANWTPATTLAICKAKFRERAAEFLSESEELRAAQDFDTFRNLVIARFQAKEPLVVRMQKFTTCRQLSDENVIQYATRIKSLSTRYFGSTGEVTAEVRAISDSATAGQFVAGLNDKIKRFVLSKGPVTLEEAINCAILEEQNLALMNRNFQVGTIEEKECETGKAQTLLVSAVEKLTQRLEAVELGKGNVSRENRDSHTVSRGGKRSGRVRPLRAVHLKDQQQPRDTNSGDSNEKEAGNVTPWQNNGIKSCFNCGAFDHLVRNCRLPRRGGFSSNSRGPRFGRPGNRRTGQHPPFWSGVGYFPNGSYENTLFTATGDVRNLMPGYGVPVFFQGQTSTFGNDRNGFPSAQSRGYGPTAPRHSEGSNVATSYRVPQYDDGFDRAPGQTLECTEPTGNNSPMLQYGGDVGPVYPNQRQSVSKATGVFHGNLNKASGVLPGNLNY